MTYNIFFWALCVLLAAQLVVAVVSIVKAYRNVGNLRLSKAASTSGRTENGHFLS